jgi:S1-C subfamily serine protease
MSIFFFSQMNTLSASKSPMMTRNAQGERVAIDSVPIRKWQPPPPVVHLKNRFDTGVMELVTSMTTGGAELEMADLIDLVEPSIVRIKVEGAEGEGIGSGFFIDNEGKIVTNYHVVQGAKKVVVGTADGRNTEAAGFLIANSDQDLAIIQIDPSLLKIKPIVIAKQLPRRGEKVAAFGAPQGFSFSSTQGIISGIRDGTEISETLNEMTKIDIYGMLGYSKEVQWIQSTVPISGGNSGGPLVNMNGELIGVNTWTHPGGQNLNFASAVGEVEKIFKERDDKLREFKHFPSPRIRSQSGGN